MIVKIEKLNHQGEGLAKVNGKVTFIPYTLPGEVVDITLTKEKKNYNIAKLNKVIEKSSNRIEAKCPYYTKCGGCTFLHTTYENELKIKKENVEDILRKYANIKMNIEVIPSDKIYNYRNKATLQSKNGKMGFYKKGTNEIIEVNNCLLVKEIINNKIKTLNTKNEQIIIKTNEKEELLTNEEEGDFIIETNENRFKVNINSFFQVNPYTYEKLFCYVKENVNKSKTLLDLYCGVGTFSILLSSKFNKVYGIEINENAYKNALENKRLNNAENVDFLLGKVEEKIIEIKTKIDTVIIDPPRSGLDKKTKQFIKTSKPKEIIYISCNPITLGRDLNELKDNYEIKSIKSFDMFPRTEHIETVAILKKL